MSISNRKFKTFKAKFKTRVKTEIQDNSSNTSKSVINMHALDDILRKLEQAVKLEDKIKYSQHAGLWLAESKPIERLGLNLMDKEAGRILNTDNLIRKEFESKYLEAVASRRRRAKLIPPKENNLTI